MFDDLFAPAAEDLVYQHADPAAVTYTDPDTAIETDLTAIVLEGAVETRVGVHGTLERVRKRTVQILDDELDHDTLKQWGTITVSGVVYGILRISDPQGGLYQVDLEAISPAEMGRRGLRQGAK